MTTDLLWATLRVLVACAAGVLLWKAWRSAVAAADQSTARIAALGLLLRAVAGIVLFWLSYLRLPIAPSLNLGGGFWVFALDASEYMRLAHEAAYRGVFAIASLDRTIPSASFVQALAITQTVLGNEVSVALLLNCACFVAAVLLITRWTASLGNHGRSSGRLAVVVVSLQPSWILWATQPLKDALFGFLVIAWFYASHRWYGVSAEQAGYRQRTLWTLALAVVLYSIAGIRAYFALILWFAFGMATAVSLLQSGTRRLQHTIVAVLSWVLLSQVIVWSAEPYLPSPARRILAPFAKTAQTAQPSIVESVDAARSGFVAGGGATQIVPSGATQTVPSGATQTVPSGRNEGQPRSVSMRVAFVSGMSAIFLPRTIGQKLGLFQISGGRGAWLFADLDTLFFVVASLLSVLLTLQNVRKTGRMSASALQVVISCVLVAVPLALVVTNFGTLFRLREMILMPLSLGPLAASVESTPHLFSRPNTWLLKPPVTK